MAYGLRIINDDSQLLIDSDYVNPTFIQKLEFNATPTYTEIGVASYNSNGLANLHSGYIKREYSTSSATLNTGNYIVLWKLPDNGNIDVFYYFPTSTMGINKTLTCEVYANSSAAALTYTLPTAYIFAVDVGGISTLSATGPALALYNSSSQLTFNSSFTQLVPYSFSDQFSTPGYDTPLNIVLDTPTNAIYLLPQTYTMFQLTATDSNNNSISGKVDKVLYNAMYKRYGSSIYAKYISTYWNRTDGTQNGIAQYGTGTSGYKSIMVSNTDLYQTASPSTGGGTNPAFTLTRSVASVNEGSTFTITLTITNATVPNGTSYGYNVTGVQGSLDFTASATSFVVTNNTASITFTVLNDALTEGTETFTLALTTDPYPSISVTINDTSLTPAATYTLTPATSSVNEGSSLTFTVGGTNITNGTYYWSLSNAGDFGTNANSFTITNNSGSFSVTPTADSLTEGAETFYAIIQDSGLNTLKTSSTITINDTSLTPTPTYSFTRSVTSVNEGGSFTITFNTNQSGNFAYTITGVTSADLEGASLTNTISNGQSHLFAVANDVTTEGSETFTIALNNGQVSTTVTINDTSVTPPAYSFTSQQNVTETQTGNSIATFTFTNVVNKTVTFAIVAPSSGAAATSGTDVTINITSMSINGSGSRDVSYYPAADQITENTEYFRITATIDGSVVATTSNIQITDSSIYPAAGTLISQSCAAYGVAPYTLNKVYADGNGGTYTEGTYNSPTCGYVVPTTYTLTPAANSVNEGSSLTFTAGGTSITNGTYYWTITNSGDFGTTSGSFTITSNSGSFSVTPTADSTTEGAETFTASIRSGSTSGTILVTSGSVTINDTSLTPAATYTLTAGAASVNEGSSVTFTAGGTNIANGTYYWTITNSGDFGTTSGSFTITNNSGSFSVSPTADSTTEGSETFTATIRDASFNALATSGSVTINDTSLTPAATPTYSFTSTANISENSTNGTAVFSYTNAPSTTVSFAKLDPIYGNSGASDVTLNTTSATISGNGTVNVTYSAAADSFTEGTEYFVINAILTGVTNAVAITTVSIADTSTTPVAATPIWRTTTTNSTWLVPAGVTSLTVVVLGGGAGGRGGGSTGGGGGAGGITQNNAFAVTPGETLTLTIGSGGGNNTNGGTTTISGNSGSVSMLGGTVGTVLTGGTSGNGIFGQYGGGLGVNQSGNIASGGGGGVWGQGYTGSAGEGGTGGYGVNFTIGNTINTTYGCGGGGGGGGTSSGGFSNVTKDQAGNVTGYVAGGGTGGSDTGIGENATQPGSGGGGGGSGRVAGGSGFRGQIWWYG